MKVLVTRPSGQAHEWVQALQAAGVDAVALPLIEIGPAPHPDAVVQAWRHLPQTDLVVFVSPSAVEQFFAARPPDRAWPAPTRAASPGPGTDRELARHGVPEHARLLPAVDAVQFDSEALWQVLRPLGWQGRSVLIVRGTSGRDWLARQLREAGARVRFVSAYERRPPRLDGPARACFEAAVQAPAHHVWLLSSSESVDHLRALCEACALQPDWPAFQAVATHPRIAATARRAGMGRVTECTPSVADVVRSIQSLAP